MKSRRCQLLPAVFGCQRDAAESFPGAGRTNRFEPVEVAVGGRLRIADAIGAACLIGPSWTW
jgi:hypothetical protein